MSEEAAVQTKPTPMWSNGFAIAMALLGVFFVLPALAGLGISVYNGIRYRSAVSWMVALLNLAVIVFGIAFIASQM